MRRRLSPLPLLPRKKRKKNYPNSIGRRSNSARYKRWIDRAASLFPLSSRQFAAFPPSSSVACSRVLESTSWGDNSRAPRVYVTIPYVTSERGSGAGGGEEEEGTCDGGTLVRIEEDKGRVAAREGRYGGDRYTFVSTGW